MNREIKTITVHTNGEGSLDIRATCYGNWAVHSTLGFDYTGWSVTYVPRGIAAAIQLRPLERALQVAEDLNREVPEYRDELVELVKSIVDGYRVVERIR